MAMAANLAAIVRRAVIVRRVVVRAVTIAVLVAVVKGAAVKAEGGQKVGTKAGTIVVRGAADDLLKAGSQPISNWRS